LDRVTVPISPTEASLGLIAPLLDRTILDAEVAAGAELSLGTGIGQVIHDGGRVAGATLRGASGKRYDVRADLVVGADGRGSRAAEAVGATLFAASRRDGLRLLPRYREPRLSLVLRRRHLGWCHPNDDSLHCVFAGCRPKEHEATFPDPLIGMTAIIPEFDAELAERVAAGPTERLRRFPGASAHLRARIGAGWAMVGDAAFFKDPATAHGITDALLDAHYLKVSDVSAHRTF